MAIMAKKSAGGNYTPPPADTYPAVCVGVFDLGTQENPFGAPKGQVMILWEIDCDKDNGEHHTVSNIYTCSLHPDANFRKLVEAWSGAQMSESQIEEGFDATKLLGKPCMLQVIHKKGTGKSLGKVFANVGVVMKVGKGQQPMTPTLKPVHYSWDEHGKEIPAGVPKWAGEKIQQSLEWRGEMPAVEDGEAKEPDTANGADELKQEAAGFF